MKKIIFTLFIFFAISSFAQEGFYLLTTMSGDSVGDQFSVVSHIGDVNADGFDDVIVGAPGGDYAKLFFGGAVFDTIPDLIFRDYKQYNCQFGCSFASDGDVNGDGYPDLIIGASSTWIEWMVTGAAYVYFGGPTIDTTADLTLIVGVWPEYGWQYGFGKSVAVSYTHLRAHETVLDLVCRLLLEKKKTYTKKKKMLEYQSTQHKVIY